MFDIKISCYAYWLSTHFFANCFHTKNHVWPHFGPLRPSKAVSIVGQLESAPAHFTKSGLTTFSFQENPIIYERSCNLGNGNSPGRNGMVCRCLSCHGRHSHSFWGIQLKNKLAHEKFLNKTA